MYWDKNSMGDILFLTNPDSMEWSRGFERCSLVCFHWGYLRETPWGYPRHGCPELPCASILLGVSGSSLFNIPKIQSTYMIIDGGFLKWGVPQNIWSIMETPYLEIDDDMGYPYDSGFTSKARWSPTRRVISYLSTNETRWCPPPVISWFINYSKYIDMLPPNQPHSEMGLMYTWLVVWNIFYFPIYWE